MNLAGAFLPGAVLSRNLWAVLAVVMAAATASAQSAEINGKVVKVEGDAVQVSVGGTLRPQMGDPVNLGRILPGVDQPALVATGQVVAVAGDLVTVKVLTRTAIIREGYAARILAAHPVQASTTTPTQPTSSTQPPAAAGQVLMTIELGADPHPWEGTVAGLAASGTVTARSTEKPDRAGRIGLGECLAICGSSAAQQPQGLFRAEVTEVGADDTVTFKVAAATLAKLNRGDRVGLFRPQKIDPPQGRSLPDWAPLEVSAAVQDPAKVVHLLSQIGAALHSYLDANRSFPPAVIYGPDGKPWHSWRVLLLPYIESMALYQAYHFDEPWDGPRNRKLLDTMPAIFRDPLDENPRSNSTAFAALVGERAAFKTVTAPAAMLASAKWQLPSLGRRAYEFKDGLSSTLILGYLPAARRIPWSKPEDFTVGAEPIRVGTENGFAAPFGSPSQRKGVFLFADGSVHYVSADTPPETIAKFVTINGGELVKPEEEFKVPPHAPVIRIVERAGAVVAIVTQ